MMYDIDIQRACDSDNLPSDEKIHRWISQALAERREHIEMSVRIVDSDESQSLNHQYRDKNKPTNVLSFPSDLPAELDLPLLGDLVICAPVVEREAQEQGKTLEAHWAHMLTHGTLHLLGYDHIDDKDAEVMENLETDILTAQGYPAPYEVTDH